MYLICTQDKWVRFLQEALYRLISYKWRGGLEKVPAESHKLNDVGSNPTLATMSKGYSAVFGPSP